MGPLVRELSNRRSWKAKHLGSSGLFSIAMSSIDQHPQVINLLLSAGVPVGPDRDKVFQKLADNKANVVVTRELEVHASRLMSAQYAVFRGTQPKTLRCSSNWCRHSRTVPCLGGSKDVTENHFPAVPAAQLYEILQGNSTLWCLT